MIDELAIIVEGRDGGKVLSVKPWDDYREWVIGSYGKLPLFAGEWPQRFVLLLSAVTSYVKGHEV